MASFASIINKAKKDWNCPGLMDGASAELGPKIPFSSPLMNYATYGGIPRGRITEFFGFPGGGKSTTTVDICKNACALFQDEYTAQVIEYQDKISSGNKALIAELEELQERGPKKVLYVDLEHAFDGKWSRTIGLDATEIELMQPPDEPAEHILQTVLELIQSGETGMVVLDSIPSLTTEAELNKKFGERTVASLAGLMTIFLRKVVPLLTRYDCTLVLINQIRVNMDNPYVVNTPGGEAIKFYSSLRMQFKIGAPVDFVGTELPQNAENPAGYIINVKLIKQKSAPFDRKNASYHLMAKSGIRVDMDIADLAVKKYGIIKKSGAWYTVCDPTTGEVISNEAGNPIKLNGMPKVLDYLQMNQDYFQKVTKFILDDIAGNSEDESSEG